MDSSSPHAILQKIYIASWLRAHGKFVRPELTRQQKQELKECFELIDADGSGAIDASELLTAFNVLGMRTKKAEVEAMLAEVDADGSGEVEYSEFVQIMTTKLDKQEDTSIYSPKKAKPAKQQTLPFPLLARAYRRKKLMEAVMGGDKVSQERLQARADAAEVERQALRDEASNKKDAIQNFKEQKVLIDKANQRIRKNARLKEKEFANLQKSLESMDPKVQNDLLDIQKRAYQRRLETQADPQKKLGSSITLKPNEPSKLEDSPTKEANDTNITKMKEVLEYIRSCKMKKLPSQCPAAACTSTLQKYREEYKELTEFQNKVEHKPVLEEQLLHITVLKKIQKYFDENNCQCETKLLEEASKPFISAHSKSAAKLHPKSRLEPTKIWSRPSLRKPALPTWH